MNEKDVEIVCSTRLRPQIAVQLWVGDNPVIVLGTAASSFHSDILRTFLEDKGLEYLTQKAIGNSKDIPRLGGKGYRVCGMGTAFLDFDKKEYRGIIEWGNDYGIMYINKEHRELFEASLKRNDWTCL